MKLTKPRFYDDFICIGKECTDNCCIGWEIDIDPAAMERFGRVGGEFGETLRSAIRTDGGCPTFATAEGERCALLREDGLCSLILHEGEDILCDICTLHPRFFGWYNDLKEAGLGLCCEEVCRLLLADSTPLSFTDGETDEEAEETCSEELLQYLLAVRSRLYEIMQNREMPLSDRLYTAACYASEVQGIIDNGGFSLPEITWEKAQSGNRSATASALFSLFETTESLNTEWDNKLSELIEHSTELAEKLPQFLSANSDRAWKYEHIAVYFIYRHFLGGVFEGEIYSRVGLGIMAVLGIALTDCLTWSQKGSLTEWDEILNLKLFSKQMEYSDENLDILLDAVWEVTDLSPDRTASALIF